MAILRPDLPLPNLSTKTLNAMRSRLGRRVVHFANLPIKLMLPSPPFDSIREFAIRSHRLVPSWTSASAAAASATVANLFSPSTAVGNDGGVSIGLSLWRRSLATTLVDIASGFSGVIGARALSPSSLADSDHPFKLSTQPLPQPPPLSDLTRQDQIRPVGIRSETTPPISSTRTRLVPPTRSVPLSRTRSVPPTQLLPLTRLIPCLTRSMPLSLLITSPIQSTFLPLIL